MNPEHMYRRTGNPLYVMAAIANYELCPDGAPWPKWVTDYVRDVAAVLVLMADEGQPAAAAKQVTAVLGLTAHGRRNRFAEYQMDKRADAAVWAHEHGRDVFQEGGKKPSNAAINRWLAKATRSNATASAARHWLERGRRLK